MNIRVGFGYDVHQLVEGRKLFLGGIHIEHSMGLLGHSDADVLIHAICDALLGAANLRDIGYHFPDSDERYHNIDSKVLLRETVALLYDKGYAIGNIDATICAEQPKLNPHIPSMVAPIVITRNTIRREIPLCILASVVLLVCANDVLLDHAPMNVISSTDGLILLCFFVIFLGYSIAISKNTNEKTAEIEIKALSWWKSITFILLGLAALIFGGQIFVNGAIGIARGLGISEAVIGVTIVAIGTSLPELATSVVAAMKKNPEIAIGNIIGSNLFNIFFILGCSATITPLFPKGISNFDYLWLVASSILLWFFGLFFGKRIIMRFEGIILILAWVVYTAWLIIRM